MADRSAPAPAPVATEAAVEEQLAEGQRVRLIALMSRPDLNGRVGSVVAWSAERGRYTVSVQGEMIALKRVNLAPAPPVEIA